MRTIHNLKVLKKKRKYLRNNATKAEKILWQKLKNSHIGYKFRRQHSIGKYIVDFYCPELKLVIELDGESHIFRNQINHDYIRDMVLEELNFKTIRFANNEVMDNIGIVLYKIKNLIKNINL